MWPTNCSKHPYLKFRKLSNALLRFFSFRNLFGFLSSVSQLLTDDDSVLRCLTSIHDPRLQLFGSLFETAVCHLFSHSPNNRLSTVV